jgi:phage tail sheath gpL-like
MALDSASRASAVGSSVDNVAFSPPAENLPRKILCIGTYDPLKVAVVDNVAKRVFSPEDAGDQTGFGFMLHRLVTQAFAGGQGIPVYILPQSEVGVAAAGEIDFTGSAGVLAGTLWLYIAGIAVPVTITAAMTIEDIADAVVAAITAKKELPVTAVKVAVTFEVTITAKSKGPEGNNISIAFNLGAGQELPTGVVTAITGMAGGATNPNISTALDGLGIGDNANEEHFTDVVHGYGQDTTVQDAILAYVGAGDTVTGLYAKTVARPFYAMTGDTAAGSAGLTALLAAADLRKTDRANCVIAVPDSPSHPSEIAAQAVGHIARIAQNIVAQDYVDIVLDGIWPGDKGTDRWTSEYDNRDAAYKGGISTTQVVSAQVLMQDMVTFYRPDNVPADSNGYRDIVNICKTQNILDSQRRLFSTEKWQGIFIVTNVAAVRSALDKTKARSVQAVKDELLGWYINVLAAKGWIADLDFAINKLKEADSVTVKSGGGGFDIKNRFVYSGAGKIKDVVTEFDTSFASLAQG